jgi:hypothetical protein
MPRQAPAWTRLVFFTPSWSLRELVRQIEITPPAVGYCVERGEVIARKNGYWLIE